MLIKFGSVFRRIKEKFLVVEFSVFHGLCGKRKEQSGTGYFSQRVKARVEKKAAVVPSSGYSQEFNLR